MKKSEPAPSVQCAFAMCTYSAMAKIKLPTGRANLCRDHYDKHYQAQADAFCDKENLRSVSDKQAWIKAKLSKPRPVGNFWAKEIMERVQYGHPVSLLAYEMATKAIGPAPSREPGSDDE